MAELMYDLSTVRTVLSQSAAFRTWCGAANEAAAGAHIGYFAMDTSAMPMAVVCFNNAWTRECITLDQEYLTTPSVTVTFAKTCTKTDSDATVFSALTTSIDAIMAELEAQTTWRIRTWQPESENTPERADAAANTDVVAFTLILVGDQRE